MRIKRKFPIGGIFSHAIFVASVHTGVWNQLAGFEKFVFGLGLVLLFLSDWEEIIER